MSSEKYIGLDVHQATISVAVLDSQGKTLMESILETKASTLLEFFAGLPLADSQAPPQFPRQTGTPTNRPPKMHINNKGDCAFFAPTRQPDRAAKMGWSIQSCVEGSCTTRKLNVVKSG